MSKEAVIPTTDDYMKRLTSILLIGLSLTTASLLAELEEVTLRWRATAVCLDDCQKLLEKQFKRISGAADVTIDGTAGTANIRWKPRNRFLFFDINTALRMVGVALNDIHITVRGTISHAGQRVTLNSLGDDTAFILLSPLEMDPNKTVVPASVDSYRLQPETYQQLLKAESEFRIVSVTGTMLLPYRSPPNYLIIESLNIIGGQKQASGTTPRTIYPPTGAPESSVAQPPMRP